jgi:hypothetical protein
MIKIRDELKKERKERYIKFNYREEFEENIFTVLEDTCLRLARREYADD